LTEAVVIDSSALVALVLKEPEAQRMLAAVLATDIRQVSSFSVLETSLVLSSRKGAPGQVLFDSLLEFLRIEVVPLGLDHVRAARQAWARFGKGQHSAALNIGDCCSYALAQISGFPLLCKGQDFPQTDLPLMDY